MSGPDQLRAAVERLGESRRALITGHERPDGDSLGSQLALAELARSYGVTPVIVNHDPPPSSLEALPGIDTVRFQSELPPDFPGGYDLVVMLECPERERAGFAGLESLPVVNIDHHPANLRYGVVNFVDVEAPAVGEMVWRMFGVAGVRPSADAATNAFVALSTDTGDFRYSNASGRAFRAAAEMVEAGASPPKVARWIHGRRRVAAVRLLGEALSSLRLFAGGRIAVIEAGQDAFQRAGAAPEDTDDVINHPRAIDGVRAAVFLKQWEPGLVRISLRSADDIDVRRVAEQFGGGGHANAAGCTVEGDLEAVREAIVAALDGALEPVP